VSFGSDSGVAAVSVARVASASGLRAANHPALIRAFHYDFCLRIARSTRSVENFFARHAASPGTDRSRRRVAHPRRRRPRARRRRAFAGIAEMPVAQDFLEWLENGDRRAVENRSHARSNARIIEATHRSSIAPLRRCPPFVKRIRCFLRGAVVIGAQCTSIRDCTVPISPSHHG